MIGVREAIQATIIMSLVMFLKFLVSNLRWGGSKVKAGRRPPEDSYQNLTPTPEEIAKEARAARIVANDLENIPLALILAWGTVLCLMLSNNEDDCIAHIALLAIFTAFRVLHTLMYEMGIAIGRSLVWAIALFAQTGIPIIGIISAFR